MRTKELTKKEKEKKIKIIYFIMYLILVFIVLFCLGNILFLGLELNHQKIKLNASQELLIFSIEELSYCVNNLNISFEDFSDDFVRYKVEEIMEKKNE